MPRSIPSRTATKIARFVLLLDALPRLREVLPAGAADAVERILRASQAVPASHIEAMRKPATLRLFAWTERLLGRGQVLWFGLRKRWMADQVEAAIAEGARQLLVVGAGFDPLAAQVAARHPEVLCIEVDTPATAEPKRAGVEGAGLARPNHLVVPADLSRTKLAQVLSATPWRKTVRSITIAEGLLMYLRPAEVESFLSEVGACSPEGSRIAFSTLDADERGRPRVGVLNGPIRFALRLAGEPLQWGIRPRDVPQFLGARGHRVLEQATLDMLRSRYLEPLGLHDEPVSPYEHLVLARRS